MTTVGENPSRHMELAGAAVARTDIEGATAHLSAAIRGFTEAGEVCRAALACVDLGNLFQDYLFNLTAARAWYVRATRLVENEPPCVEQGWVAVAGMGCDADDPATLLAGAELALDRARRFGDLNLESKALADAGLAHVQAGRVAAGMALLDEAMALACGPVDDEMVAGRSVCSFFTACYHAADFDRADSWAATLRHRGLIGRKPGAPVLIAGHCSSVQATALCELGRWTEAETVLTRAADETESVMPGFNWHPAISLAELRIRQGRLAEAEALLLGKDGHLQALLPTALLHLSREDYDLARATAARGLRALKGDRLRAAQLLTVLVDVELGQGNVEAAIAACDSLVARSHQVEVPGLQARVAATRSRVLAASGHLPEAIATLEHALDELCGAGSPVLRLNLLVGLVRVHEQAGNTAAAKVEASRAAAALVALDITLDRAAAALLDRVSNATAPAEPGLRRAALVRAHDGWIVEYGHERTRLPDTKGIRYLAELLASPGVERHALDLVDRVEGSDPGLDRRRLGDAGELADSRARADYRRRIEQLRSEIDDAVETGSQVRAETLQAELDHLVAQLASAFGLSGRSRRASSAAERARLNVTRALRAATARIQEAVPEPGRVLDRRLRTGLYCAFEPADGDGVRWIVQDGLNEIRNA